MNQEGSPAWAGSTPRGQPFHRLVTQARWRGRRPRCQGWTGSATSTYKG